LLCVVRRSQVTGDGVNRAAAHASDDGGWDDAVAAARDGDAAAFTWLYLETQPRLIRYAAALAGQDAEDVTAEAWSQIVRDLPHFDGDLDKFRGWASTIVRNRAIDAARARSRRPVQADDLTDLLDLPHEVDSATVAAENMSTAAAIAMIASLPRDQAEAIMLRAIVGLDAKAAGKVLGKRAGAVRAAAHRGLKTLHRRLEARDADEAKVTDE
jgi:RNA polymerase sigma-70 factor (ECF subfamily)